MNFYGELLERDGTEEKPDVMQGVLLAEVTENWDEEHPGMVKVQILMGEEENCGLGWVPVAVPYAGNEYGTYCLPEIGSQVLLAFHMGNFKSPYVIGCIYNQENVLPPETANENNSIKSIKTKGGNQITVSDEEGKEKITVRTKGELLFEMDDENNKISVGGAELKNAVLIDAAEGALTIKAEKKIIFCAKESEVLVLDGEGKKAALKTDQISLEAGQKLNLKGQNLAVDGSSTQIKGQKIKMESQASLELKGTASLKAESSGMTEIKGSITKIN